MTAEPLASDVLRQIPIFRGLSAAECRQLARIGGTLEFKPGEIIVREGEQSQRLWILLEGSCEVVKRLQVGRPAVEPVVLATLDPYNNFGEMSFFHTAPHSASVRAQTAVRLLRLERAAYDALVRQESRAACKLAINAVDSLAERLRRMDDWVVQLLTSGAAGRRIPEWQQLRAAVFDGWKL